MYLQHVFEKQKLEKQKSRSISYSTTLGRQLMQLV